MVTRKLLEQAHDMAHERPDYPDPDEFDCEAGIVYEGKRTLTRIYYPGVIGNAQMKAAILFSGGDAPGMNACLRAFTRLGLTRHKAKVLGVKDGYQGVVRPCQMIAEGIMTFEGIRHEIARYRGVAGFKRASLDIVSLDHESASGIVHRGGMVLGSARCKDFVDRDVRRQVIDFLADLDVDAVVVVGGNGSLAGARCLAEESSLRVIGIPATIDDDVNVSEECLGADTAVNTLVAAIRKFNDTADAHHRVMVLETMGRDTGNLARMAALASGAEIVVTPERGVLHQIRMQDLAERIERSMLQGRRHAIVLVAEGAEGVRTDLGQTNAAASLAAFLTAYFQTLNQPLCGIETRCSVLGHLQRGGPPTAADCVLAARFAEAAWEAIVARSKRSGVLAVVRGRIKLQRWETDREAEVDAAQQRDYQLQKDITKPLPNDHEATQSGKQLSERRVEHVPQQAQAGNKRIRPRTR